MEDKLVLIVDDEGLVKEYLEELMQRHNYKSASFTDPREALVFFQMNSARVSIVVADIKMPDITGYQLAQELNKIKPDVPVILISAYFPSLKAVQETPNVKRVLSKPLSTKLLLEAIETEINESVRKASGS